MMSLPPEKQQAKRETRDLIRDAGGLEVAAMECRPGTSQLARAYQPDSDNWLTLDAIMDLEDVTHGKSSHPRIARFLGARQGYALVKLPAGEAPSIEDVHALLGESVREAADLHGAICDAVRDRRIDLKEAAMIRQHALDEAETAMRIAALCDQILEAGR